MESSLTPAKAQPAACQTTPGSSQVAGSHRARGGSDASSPGRARRELRWEARRAIAVGTGAILVACVLVASAPGTSSVAGRFAVGALGAWFIVALTLSTLAAAAPSSSGARAGPVRGSLGAATRLTLLRGLLVSLLAGFVSPPPPLALAGGGAGAETWLAWAPGLLYAAAALTDHYDGKLARRWSQVTELGRRLDVAMDGLGLLVASLVAVRWHRLPRAYLAVGAAYYVFHAGLVARRWLGWPVHLDRLRPNRGARFFAGVHMVLCAAALLPPWLPLQRPLFLALVSALAMAPTLFFFMRDWGFAVGLWSPRGSPAPSARPRSR